MIVKQVSARNFRKFAQLNLESLPAKGLFTLIGKNESGKSSIGDVICYALYGRTDILDTSQTPKLIRWGEEEADVELEFTHNDTTYKIKRTLNKDSESEVSLWNMDEVNLIADEKEEVEEQLKHILGYGFPTFLRTFYWGQEVSTDKESDAESLQSMAGVKPYIRLHDELKQESREQLEVLTRLEKEHKANVAARDSIELDRSLLGNLQSSQEELEDNHKQNSTLSKNIQLFAEKYTDKQKQFHGVRSFLHKLHLITAIGLILALVALLGWAIITYLPEMATKLSSLFGQKPEALARPTLWTGLSITLLTLGVSIYSWFAKRKRLLPLRQQARDYLQALQDSATQLETDFAEMGAQYLPGHMQDYLPEQNDAEDAEPPEDIMSEDRTGDIPKKVLKFNATQDDVSMRSEHMATQLSNQNQELSQYLDVLKQEIAKEQARTDQFDALDNEIIRLKEQIQPLQYQLKTGKLAMELIQSASKDAIQRFNASVNEQCKQLLKTFTQSHYHDLKISSDLNLLVYSPEKQDYLDFAETSAGTRRQIAMAMRIALADALVNATGNNQQVLFMDEPFVFFDAERTMATLSSLQAITDSPLSQVWVTTQELPEGLQPDHVIECKQKEGALVVTSGFVETEDTESKEEENA
jgi:exonuclease SbcC